MDSLTGLYNLRARYYDPVSGRFLSRDQAAIAAGSVADLNRYRYARNNPINVSDPSGYGVLDYVLATSVATDVEVSVGFEFAEDLALGYISDLLYLVLPEEEATEIYAWIEAAFQALKDLHDLFDILDVIQQIIQAVTSSSSSGSPGGGPAPSPTPPPVAPTPQYAFVLIQTSLRQQQCPSVDPASGLPVKIVYLSIFSYPGSTLHIAEARALKGKPYILTIDRPGANARGRRSIANSGLPSLAPTWERDEYPPKVAVENGGHADVKYVADWDNAGAGAKMGSQINHPRQPDGSKFCIQLVP